MQSPSWIWSWAVRNSSSITEDQVSWCSFPEAPQEVFQMATCQIGLLGLDGLGIGLHTAQPALMRRVQRCAACSFVPFKFLDSMFWAMPQPSSFRKPFFPGCDTLRFVSVGPSCWCPTSGARADASVSRCSQGWSCKVLYKMFTIVCQRMVCDSM